MQLNDTIRRRALIIDDLEEARVLYSRALESIGFDVSTVSSVPADDFFQGQTIDLILLDVRLGKQNGIAHIPKLRELTDAYVLVLTAFGSIDLAVEAVKAGASGFYLKSDSMEILLAKISALFSMDDATDPLEAFQIKTGIIGKSQRVRQLMQLIYQVGASEATVLILGESGTGKELVARALHLRSRSQIGPFMAINCSAIPEQLLESELFGVKKGAFTDARQDRKGLFETANNGTLFLDEIGEMSLALQAKLLRVVQEKEFTPLGSSQKLKLTARIVCATNRNLLDRIKEKQFREDLYYRIAVVSLQAPNLRDRREDIPLIVGHFLEIYNRSCSKRLHMPSSSQISVLQSYTWPGNVRELQNSVERSTILSRGPTLSIEYMIPVMKNAQEIDALQLDDDLHHLPFKDFKEKFERKYFETLLLKSGGNLAEASRISGIYRANLYRIAKRLSIDLGRIQKVGSDG